MDQTLITNWNQLVAEDDIVYCLGDFTLGNKMAAARYFNQLLGTIYVVPGSHDRRWLPDYGDIRTHYYSMSGVGVIILPPLYTLRVKELTIILCHYAMRVWDKSHYNSYQCFGHSHGRLPGVGKQHDVGVDNNNFCPISILQLREIMKSKPNNANYIGR